MDVLRRARRTLDGLAEFLADDPQILNFRMTGYDKLGNLESALGALVAAEESYTKTRDIAVQLEARFPGNPLYPQNRAIATAQIAALYLRRGDYKTADAMLDTVVPVAAEQLAAHPNDVRALELESIVRLYLYEREVRFERWQNTEPLMRERCALYSRLARADPNNPARTRDVIDGDCELAALLASFNKTDEAGPILLRAATEADAAPRPGISAGALAPRRGPLRTRRVPRQPEAVPAGGRRVHHRAQRVRVAGAAVRELPAVPVPASERTLLPRHPDRG